jgi:ferredoxin
MAFMITDECISCGACESGCPTSAISEGADKYQIDPNKCVECVGFYDTQQCADVCPVDAPQPDPDHPRK